MIATVRSLFTRAREFAIGPAVHPWIYFHSPCFDGIVSAVLTWDFVETVLKWKVRDLQPVNYRMRETWLASTLVQPCAVVDFLYHPLATFWADHHSTTFLSPGARQHFEDNNGPLLAYDESADSCAQLLWEHLWSAFGYRNNRYSELVSWTIKTDAARYVSVKEAIEGDAPALRINDSLAYGRDDDYSAFLVRHLKTAPLDVVAGLREVQSRYERSRREVAKGLKLFSSNARLDGDVVVFDIDARDGIVPRYAPYYFFPQASYSAGIIRREGSTTVTAMRNPWREFPSVHLGEFFGRVGGGGHPRIGSIVLRGNEASRAEGLLEQLVRVLHSSQSRLHRVSATYSR